MTNMQQIFENNTQYHPVWYQQDIIASAKILACLNTRLMMVFGGKPFWFCYWHHYLGMRKPRHDYRAAVTEKLTREAARRQIRRVALDFQNNIRVSSLAYIVADDKEAAAIYLDQLVKSCNKYDDESPERLPQIKKLMYFMATPISKKHLLKIPSFAEVVKKKLYTLHPHSDDVPLWWRLIFNKKMPPVRK